MRLIDAQVHAYERNHKERPWVDELVGPKRLLVILWLGKWRALVWMVQFGSPWTMYRYDASYANSVYEKYP